MIDEKAEEYDAVAELKEAVALTNADEGAEVAEAEPPDRGN